MARSAAFHRLWALGVELGGRVEGGVLPIFDDGEVGLILIAAQGRDRYHVSPMNGDTFAHTGGDGVHFSSLDIGHGAENGPVVMTVPMMDLNIVVGENFVDFLSLGCCFGYFGLEQLAYDRDRTIEHIQSGRHAFRPPGSSVPLLSAIRERFGLQPWESVRGHLDALHDRLFASIRLAAS